MKIYELNLEIEKLLDKYYSCFDQDTWELIVTQEDNDKIQNELLELQNQKTDFIDWILKNRANTMADLKQIQEEIKRLETLSNIISKKIEKSNKFIEFLIKPLYKGKTIIVWLFSVWFRKSSQIIIKDENLIDFKYKKEKISISIDKISIKKDLEAWIEVEGAYIQDNLNLQIK